MGNKQFLGKMDSHKHARGFLVHKWSCNLYLDLHGSSIQVKFMFFGRFFG